MHEAPASACFKFRIGSMELLYTLRGIDDAELQRRMAATLPSLHALLDACDARAAQRTAERDAAKAAGSQAAGHPAAAAPDLQALVAQAVAAALAGSANGPASMNGQAPGAPASTPAAAAQAAPGADDQQTGFCTLHQAAMEWRENARGAWYSHYLDEEDRYCKGAKPPRRNGHRR